MTYRSALAIVSCAVSVVIGLVLAKGGKTADSAVSDRPVIGLSMDTLKEARWQVDRDVFVARANELGADVLVQSANSDDVQQAKDVDFLLTRKVDLLVIIPHNGEAMSPAVEKAHQAGVPVMAYDRMIPNCDLDLYISFDNVKVGEIQAQYLVDHLPTPGRGKIVRVFGAKTDNNAWLFKKGQDNVLDPLVKSGAIQIVHEDWAEDWKLENAKRIVNAAISRVGKEAFGDTAILASNDGTAGGAIQALSEEGLAGRVLVTGQDAELVACQRIMQGTQAMTVYKPIRSVAAKAAETAVRMAQRRPVIATSSVPNGKCDVPSVLVDVVAVDKSNMRDTVVADGFQPADQIFPKDAEAPQP